MHKNQFRLLTTRRFLPLFLTQFFGAFNDNVFKNAIVILFTFKASEQIFTSNTLVNLAAMAFILPYFLFSATFGQICDKYEKSRIARLTKLLEIVIMVIASAALYTNNIWLLLLVLFGLGTQSALFGPTKYSILPQHLEEYELVGGNALIESTTFIAILLGTLLGGYLVTVDRHAVAAAVLIIAVIGYLASLFIPRAPSFAEKLEIEKNPLKSTWHNLKLAYKQRHLFVCLLGISWFWFYGSLFFYQVGNYTKTVIGGGPHIVTFLIATFAIGIGAGALLCERLSRRNIELALVPFGAIGLTVFALIIFFLNPHVDHTHVSFFEFIHGAHNTLLVLCLFCMAACGGLYSVPLYAFIQNRSPKAIRSRIIAANNILNAIFMVLSALFAIVLLKLGLNIPHLFLVAAIINAGISAFIFFHIPEFFMRFSVYLLATTSYKIVAKGQENLPTRGPVIYACNHVSFIDVVIITAISITPIRFMMDWQLYNAPILKQLSKLAKAIPIAGKHEDETVKNQAFYRAVEALNHGEVVCIFPEGVITKDGQLGEFKHGITKLVNQTHASVIPMAVQGLWGSFFSRRYGKAMSHFPKNWKRSKVGLNIGKPIPYEEFNLDTLKAEIQRLHDDPV